MAARGGGWLDYTKGTLKIQRAFQVFDRPARNAVRIDHRGPDIRVSQQRLDGADVIVRLQEMGGEGMAERVRRYSLQYLGPTNCRVDGLLNVGLVKMIPPLLV